MASCKCGKSDDRPGSHLCECERTSVYNASTLASTANSTAAGFSITQGAVMFKPWGLEVVKLHPDAIIPTKGHQGDLGIDLYCLEDTKLQPGVTTVRTGIACNFPYGYGALIRDRSSVATKQMVLVVAGVIDQQYTGEIIVAFFSRVPSSFERGQKIAQMILTPVVEMPIVEVTELNKTTRGSHGFGSTGA